MRRQLTQPQCDTACDITAAAETFGIAVELSVAVTLEQVCANTFFGPPCRSDFPVKLRVAGLEGDDRMPPAADPGPARLEFSTDALSPAKRLSFWRDAFMRLVVNSDVQSRSPEPFRGQAWVQAMPGLRITSFKSTPARLPRSSEMAADGDDNVVLLTPSQGRLGAVQRGREVTLRPGEALLLLHEEPAALIHDNVRFQGFIFPRAALGARIGDLDAAVMRLLPRSGGPLRLLLRYLDLVRNDPSLATPGVCQSVVSHIHDLVALVIGANRDTREHALTAATSARLAAALVHIAESFADLGFVVETVARRQGISSRYLQELLEASGKSFTTRVNELRLQKAFGLLIERGSVKRRISDIALESGFADISHFNRLFRARYGDTPSGVRRGRDPRE